jgi:hypothetical protein
MLKETESPFPKKEACKNCSSKPCQWFLRNYNEPGTFMFVNKLDFISMPCGGSLKGKNVVSEQDVEPVYLTDTMDVVNKKAVITSPKQENKGGMYLTICSVNNEKILGADIIVKAGDCEIFSGIAGDGTLEIADIPASQLSVECKCQGKTEKREIQWTPGVPPYPEQIIVLSINGIGEKTEVKNDKN